MTDPSSQFFSVTRRDLEAEVTLLVCAGELDLMGAEPLRRAVDEAAGRRLVIDLTPVDFLDSTGIAVLLHARRQHAPEEFAISCPGRAAVRALEVAGLMTHLNVFTELDEAVDAAGG